MDDESEERGLGARLWVNVLGLAIGGALVVAVLFALLGRAWYTWGPLGAFLLLALIAIGVGYISDRRQAAAGRTLSDDPAVQQAAMTDARHRRAHEQARAERRQVP
jgi:hypothetical protein